MASTTLASAVCGSLSIGALGKPSIFSDSSSRVQAPAKATRLHVVSSRGNGQEVEVDSASTTGRRQSVLALTAASLALASIPLPALADFAEDYKTETQGIIDQVKTTLNLEKTDPSKPGSVATLRTMSNDWVAKYRREKSVAGKPSFSNMYSALNAISGHYISFGDGYPIPKKRSDRILEEVADAERALNRGR
eukprot:TRINITY_DN26221_c0_g1_i1.p1 TRINITY_DN26221_c0_g1~~TRINITY_DN26221_c0_g1_i1.p1  ORF type:complete len:193 (+),score=24.67 TRINITY_DN26221_c0_g1_i1:83-661(+)